MWGGSVTAREGGAPDREARHVGRGPGNGGRRRARPHLQGAAEGAGAFGHAGRCRCLGAPGGRPAVVLDLDPQRVRYRNEGGRWPCDHQNGGRCWSAPPGRCGRRPRPPGGHRPGRALRSQPDRYPGRPGGRPGHSGRSMPGAGPAARRVPSSAAPRVGAELGQRLPAHLWIAVSASRARSGWRSIRCSAVLACTLITEMLWATTRAGPCDGEPFLLARRRLLLWAAPGDRGGPLVAHPVQLGGESSVISPASRAEREYRQVCPREPISQGGHTETR